MALSTANVIRIGSFRFYRSRHQLASDKRTVHLTPKASQVLWQLIRRAGETVDRERLIASVWQNDFASDELLTRAITDLRKAFADSFRQPEYIETIPKVGYRLIAEVSQESRAEESAEDNKDQDLETTDAGGILQPAKLLWPLFLILGLMAVFYAATQSARIYELTNATAVVPPAVLVTGGNRNYTFRSLDTNNSISSRPSISGEGDLIVFSGADSDDALSGLYIHHRDGSWSTRISPPDGASYPASALSPDAQTIAFMRVNGTDCGVYTMPLYGSVLFDRLGDCDPGQASLDWSPDGRWIAYNSLLENRSRLSVIDMNSGEIIQPTAEAYPEATESLPRFSADGAIAWIMHDRSGETRLLHASGIGEIGSANEYPVEECCLDLEWNYESSDLLLLSKTMPNNGIRQIDFQNGISHLIPGSANVSGIDLARDQGSLAVVRRITDRSIWRFPLSLDAREATPFINSPRSDHSPSVSPDGQFMAFISDRTGEDQLWIIDLVSSVESQLTTLSNVRLDSAKWSPDGQYILLAARGNQDNDLLVLNRSTREVNPLALPNIEQSTQGHWRIGDNTVAFFCRIAGIWNLCETAIDAPGNIRVIQSDFPIPRLGTNIVDANLNNERFFFVDNQSGELKSLNYDDGTIEQVASPEAGQSIASLRAFGGDLVMGISNSDTPDQIDLLYAKGNAIDTPIDLFLLESLGSVSRDDQGFVADGRYLYVTRSDRIAERLELMTPNNISP